MIFFYIFLTSIIRFTLSNSSDEYKIVTSNKTREQCLVLREQQKVPNEEVMFCLARAIANSALKAFYPVENKCDSKLNIAANGKTCYSVRAWRNNGKGSNAPEHEHSQSLFLSLYYGLEKKRNFKEIDKINSIALTLTKPLDCSVVYKPSKRLSHGRGSGSSFSIRNINMDSTTYGGGISVSTGYSSPLYTILGGIETETTASYSGSSTKGTGQGTTMHFKVPSDAKCEPMLYQTALICYRQAGKLKIIDKDGKKEEILLKDDKKDKGLLMPLDESQSDYFIPILACVSRTKSIHGPFFQSRELKSKNQENQKLNDSQKAHREKMKKLKTMVLSG